MNKRILTKISEQFTILPKSKIKAGQALDSGKYPFYTSSDTKVSYLDTYEYDDEIVILGTGGKPSCNYAKGKFSFSTDNFALKTKGNVKPKYLYYFLRNNNLSILEKGFLGSGLKHIGKEYMLNILFPLEDIEKQDKIIKTLDSITQAKQNAIDRFFQLNEFIKSRFIEMFGDAKSSKYPTKKLIDVCDELFAGGDVKKNALSQTHTEEFPIPIYTNGEKNDGLYGYTNKARVCREAVTISGRGTIGYTSLRTEPFYPAVRLIVAVPNTEYISGMYLKHFIATLEYNGQGNTIPQLTVPMVKDECIPVPPISLQNTFAEFVKQVDKSKFIVQKQIDDLQELLDSKMDEYFG